MSTSSAHKTPLKSDVSSQLRTRQSAASIRHKSVSGLRTEAKGTTPTSAPKNTPTVQPRIRAQIKFGAFRTDFKAEIQIPIELLSRIRPLDMTAVYKLRGKQGNEDNRKNEWKVFELADPAINVVMAAVVEVLRPGSSRQWQVVGYDLDWAETSTRMTPTITFAAIRGEQPNSFSLPYMYVRCGHLTSDGVLECTAEYERADLYVVPA